MINQIAVKMVLDAWNAQIQHTNKLLDSLTDEQLQMEIAPDRNRGVYLLGHLTAVNDKMLPLLGFGEMKFPKLFDIFASKADKTVTEITSTSELRKNWTSSCNELDGHFKKMKTEEWFEKHTSVSAEDFAREPHRNKLNVIISRTGHLQYHLGQLNLLKKKS